MMVPWWRPQSYYDEPGRGVKARDGGGVLITQAIHSLDLFRWLLGIERVGIDDYYRGVEFTYRLMKAMSAK